MKILLIFRGNLGAVLAAHEGQTIPEAVSTRGTSHASEVNALLVAHWLQEDHGHTVDWYTTGVPAKREWMLTPTGPDVDPADYDCVLVWKIRGMKVAQSGGLFERFSGDLKVATWFDAGGLREMLHPAEADTLTHICWGTRELMGDQEDRWPGVAQSVVEHAINFIADVEPRHRTDRGLYMGRLPWAYLLAVETCSRFAPMDVFALWAPTQVAGSMVKVSLRPGCSDADLARARGCVREGLDIHISPAVNIAAEHGRLTGYLFGFCPSTRARPSQSLSASKFYDYAALGLPVVLADNTPEARYLAGNTWLGELYDPRDSESMGTAIQKIRERATDVDAFHADRCKIRDWASMGHTYRHRAREINDAIG